MVQSASGLLALLDEPNEEIQTYALKQINGLVNIFWPEIADEVVKFETLSETKTFPARDLASLVASKVHFHLGSFDEALAFALGSGTLFDVEHNESRNVHDTEYVDTVVAKALDAYISGRSQTAPEDAAIDPRLTAIVERMLSRCERDKQYTQAMGVALSARRLDVIERIVAGFPDRALLEWILDAIVLDGVLEDAGRAYKNEVLNLLIRLFSGLEEPDYISITQCFVYLNDAPQAAELLVKLVASGKTLLAYQIAFDLADTATQEFLSVVTEKVVTELGQGGASNDGSADAAGDAPSAPASDPTPASRLTAILSGDETIRLNLEFLYKNNHSDMLILKTTRGALEARTSIFHSAVSLMNAFAHAGTTSDQFLRDNLDWLVKASNWSKFTATAALGVIHKGNLKHARRVVEPYLPRDIAPGTRPDAPLFTEGGSLFALGLISANHADASTTEYLTGLLRDGPPSEVLQHGAALGLGATAMGSGSAALYETLKNVLYDDSAVAGEAAAYAMGLVMLGTGKGAALDEMLQYAHETQHEKIIRALALGMAFLMYGQEEGADSLIATLLGDADAILRYGGVYAIALAYAGTGNNRAVRRVLHVAVSDVSDDVRRAAVTALGFLLFRTPAQVPRVVQLLSESYNAHVRYGSALALGIACAGTGLAAATALLEPLTRDAVDFVRQGACVALALVMVQQNAAATAGVRGIFAAIIADKHEDALAKFGAAVAQGIIDAGGRNVTVSLQNKYGMASMPAVIGMAMFAQFWYWFPLANFLSLAFTPTALICVDEALRLPKMDVVSKCSKGLFAYPPATKPAVKESVARVATAVLSTTAKAKARANALSEAKGGAAGEGSAAGEGGAAADTTAATADSADEMRDADEAKEAPADADTDQEQTDSKDSSYTIPNMSRVPKAQLVYLALPENARYRPVRPFVPERQVRRFAELRKKGAGAVPSSAVLALGAGAGASRLGGEVVPESPRVGNGGGILLVVDSSPEQGPGEFLEMEADSHLESHNAPTSAGASLLSSSDRDNVPLLPARTAEPPEPFEYDGFE